jgi:hypothetical protein
LKQNQHILKTDSKNVQILTASMSHVKPPTQFGSFKSLGIRRQKTTTKRVETHASQNFKPFSLCEYNHPFLAFDFQNYQPLEDFKIEEI